MMQVEDRTLVVIMASRWPIAAGRITISRVAYFQAAMDAVDETDVLTADIDYIAKGRELRARLRQQPSASQAPGSDVTTPERAAADVVAAAESLPAAGGNSSAGAEELASAGPGVTLLRVLFPAQVAPPLGVCSAGCELRFQSLVS